MSRLFWEGRISQVLAGFWGGSGHRARKGRNGSWCFENKAEGVAPGNWVNSQRRDAVGARISSEFGKPVPQLWSNRGWWEPTRGLLGTAQGAGSTGYPQGLWRWAGHFESRLRFSGHKNPRILVQFMGKEMTPTTNVELSTDLGMASAESQIWWELGGIFHTQVSGSNLYQSLGPTCVHPLTQLPAPAL